MNIELGPSSRGEKGGILDDAGWKGSKAVCITIYDWRKKAKALGEASIFCCFFQK